MSAREQGRDEALVPAGASGHNGSALAATTSAAQSADRMAGEDPEQQAARLEQEIGEIRDHIGGLVTELDRRRKRLAPSQLIREGAVPLAVGGVVVAGLAIGGIFWLRARARRRDRFLGRAQRLRTALGLILEKPERLTEEPEPASFGWRLLTAAGTAAAAMAARKLTTRLLDARPVPPSRR